jgi:hypothetical protein
MARRTPTEDKKPIEVYRADPENYSETNGVIRDNKTGQIVATDPEKNPNAITTSERGRELANRRKAIGLRSKVLGLIDAYNEKAEPADRLDPDILTDEELILAAGDAIRLLHKHMTLKFLESGNLRGMGETYTKLVEPFAEDPRATQVDPPRGTITADPDALHRLLELIEEDRILRREKARAIEAETK